MARVASSDLRPRPDCESSRMGRSKYIKGMRMVQKSSERQARSAEMQTHERQAHASHKPSTQVSNALQQNHSNALRRGGVGCR